MGDGGEWLRRGAAVALCAWLVLSSLVTVRRSFDWFDDRTLYTRDLATQPRSTRLQFAAADYALTDGDQARHLLHMEQAFELKPEATRAWLRYAWFLRDPEAALEATRHGLAGAQGADAHYRFHLEWTRMQILRVVGREDDADAALDRALHELRGLLRDGTARADLRRALARNPSAPHAWIEAAKLLEARGETAQAKACLAEALRAPAPALSPMREQAQRHFARITGRVPARP